MSFQSEPIKHYSYILPIKVPLVVFFLTIPLFLGICIMSYKTQEAIVIFLAVCMFFVVLYFVALFLYYSIKGPKRLEVSHRGISLPVFPRRELRFYNYSEITSIFIHDENRVELLLVNRKSIFLNSDWFESRNELEEVVLAIHEYF